MRNKNLVYQKLCKKVAEHVEMLFALYWTPELVYHDLQHTELVVKRAMEIAADYCLSQEEKFILYVAAWFHDTGQLLVPPASHEVRSVELMSVFFQEQKISQPFIESVKQCILATRLTTEPTGTLEMILCDADTFNLGTASFRLTDDMVRQEFQLRNAMPSGDWNENTLKLLKNHRFYTPYCIERLTEGKIENIALVESKIAGRT
ncbi:HD domain-containing protein [Pedobacter suwonensis]|uniref:HD domain-containing protein n=1 Tax=Pedobacter suwonensis TaxID=332999 RepID=UPI0036C02E99